MTGSLDGRVAIVTGSARGIGRAIATVLAAAGATVVAVDILEAAGATAAEGIRQRGGRVSFMAADVSNEADVRRVVDETLAAHGRLDVMVNNAAVQIEALAADVTVADFHRIVNVNLLGCALFCRAALPAMIDGGGGSIINMSSVNAFAGDPLLPVYGATKAAIIGYTKSVAAAYGRYGIRANVICPGDVDTELNRAFFEAHDNAASFRREVEQQYPMRRIAAPEEVARVALFLASDDASFVSGAELVVDGAITSRIYEL